MGIEVTGWATDRETDHIYENIGGRGNRISARGHCILCSADSPAK